MDTDRNLLLAALALQTGFINQEQFSQICTLWTTRKHASLAELLVAQGWLTPAQLADLGRLSERHLLRHDGDVQASLAQAVGLEMRQALAALHDPEVQQALVRLSGTTGDLPTGPYLPNPWATDEGPTAP